MADLGIIGADPSEPPPHEAVVTLVNRLLGQFNIPTKIHNIEDISSALFVVLYESLFSDRLPGIIRQPNCKDDEIHNCQIVIDVLSTDVVHDNLSHIHAGDIVSGNITAISNLLDIFSYLLEYVINKIESDVPTDNEDTHSIATTEQDISEVGPPSSRVSEGNRQTKKTIPKQDPRKISSAFSNKTNNNRVRTARQFPSYKAYGQKSASLNNENRKVINHEDFYAMSHESFLNRPPSPIRADHSQSLLGQKSIDSEFEQEKWESKSQGPQTPVSLKTAVSDYQKTGEPATSQTTSMATAAAAISTVEVVLPNSAPSSTAAETGVNNGSSSLKERIFSSVHGDDEKPTSSFSATMPVPSRTREYESTDPLHSTVGPFKYQTQSTSEKPKAQTRRASTMKGFSSSYDDLQHLVEKTATIARVAVESSPVRSRTERNLDIADVRHEPLRSQISSEDVRLARELNALGLHSSDRDGAQPPSRGKMKVAFVAPEVESSHQKRPNDGYGRRPLSALSGNDYYRDLQSMYTRDTGYCSGKESDNGLNETIFRKLMNSNRHPSEHVQSNLSSQRSQVKPKKPSSKIQSLATHLAKNRQPELGAAHMTLKKEDHAMWRKQGILQRMYDEDMDEFADEVHHLLEKDANKARETEEDFIKKCLEGVPKKRTIKKGKGSAFPSTCKKCKVTTAKAPRHGANSKRHVASSTLTLQSEEDLLPILLEEFPHLHLSEHTWHELWRKGLHQIEALTRTYQASQMKKSRAQNQIEDAAERHDLLANIMKKQLEHTKRLRDVKEQKQQQVQMRNKIHDKRIQSARARRYYNEYQVRTRGKQLKKRTKEEMVFRELFKDALQIQRERITDIRQYATDQRKRQESRRQNEIDSMENFYHDQFEIMADRLSKERLETDCRDSAQQKMMERLKRELRKKMETEIRTYQDQLFQDDDDSHFRKMDADKIRQQLHIARYSTKI